MYPWVWKTGLLFWISEAILNMCVVVTIYYWIKPSKLPKFSSFAEILHSELPQKVKCMQILFSLVFSLLTKSRNRRINFGATVVVVKLPLCRLCWLHTEPEWPIQATQPPWIRDNRIFDINPYKETLATSPRLLLLKLVDLPYTMIFYLPTHSQKNTHFFFLAKRYDLCGHMYGCIKQQLRYDRANDVFVWALFGPCSVLQRWKLNHKETIKGSQTGITFCYAFYLAL